MSDSGKYIVVFKKTASKEEVQKYVDEVNSNGGLVGQVYDGPLNGFAAQIPETYLLQLQATSLGPDGPIDYIEPDQVVTIQ